MSNMKTTEVLFSELASTLGVDELFRDSSGAIKYESSDGLVVNVYSEGTDTVCFVSPVIELTPELGFGELLFLMRKNFIDSGLLPFRLGADAGGVLLLWGRLPAAELDGERLHGVLEALVAIARELRTELGGELPDDGEGSPEGSDDEGSDDEGNDLGDFDDFDDL